MAFHFQLGHAMRAQPLGIPLEDLLSFLANRPAIISKKDISKACRGRSGLLSSHFCQLSVCGGGIGFREQFTRTHSLTPTGKIVQGRAGRGARGVATRFPAFGCTSLDQEQYRPDHEQTSDSIRAGH
jgi:hypothetical protein